MIGNVGASRNVGGELCKPLDGFLAQRRGVPRDRGLACLFDARHASIERGNEFAELTHDLLARHLHGFAPLRLEFRRETFQISPQLPQRQ